MCKNWGLNKLAKKHYEESMGEMKHAEMLIDRILFLEGVPEIARYDVIRVGTDVKEQFENDLVLEMKGVKAYNEAIEPVHPGEGRRHARTAREDPGRVRRARRLAGDAARPDRAGRLAELPAVSDGRGGRGTLERCCSSSVRRAQRQAVQPPPAPVARTTSRSVLRRCSWIVSSTCGFGDPQAMANNAIRAGLASDHRDSRSRHRRTEAGRLLGRLGEAGSVPMRGRILRLSFNPAHITGGRRGCQLFCWGWTEVGSRAEKLRNRKRGSVRERGGFPNAG